jgi:hypothetical protein
LCPGPATQEETCKGRVVVVKFQRGLIPKGVGVVARRVHIGAVVEEHGGLFRLSREMERKTSLSV